MRYVLILTILLLGCNDGAPPVVVPPPIEPPPPVVEYDIGPLLEKMGDDYDVTSAVEQAVSVSGIVAGRKFGDFNPDNLVGADDYVWILSRWGQTIDGELMGSDKLTEVIAGWGNNYDAEVYCREHWPYGFPLTGVRLVTDGKIRGCQVCGNRPEPGQAWAYAEGSE